MDSPLWTQNSRESNYLFILKIKDEDQIVSLVLAR